jgi:hypothetical protein
MSQGVLTNVERLVAFEREVVTPRIYGPQLDVQGGSLDHDYGNWDKKICL